MMDQIAEAGHTSLISDLGSLRLQALSDAIVFNNFRRKIQPQNDAIMHEDLWIVCAPPEQCSHKLSKSGNLEIYTHRYLVKLKQANTIIDRGY